MEEQRWITWVEPFGPNAEPVYCFLPAKTAIAYARDIERQLGGQKKYKDDEAALDDFMATHWAQFCTAPTPLLEKML